MTSFANRSAASLDSAPVLRNIARSSGAGAMPTSASANANTGSLSMPENRWSSVAAASETTATISGWLWPRIELNCPEVKSSTARPSSV